VLDRRESALRALGIEFVLGVEVDAARIHALRARHDAVSSAPVRNGRVQ